MKLATQERFFNGEWYTHYWHHPGFAKRASRLASFPGPILVVGAAFGYLVKDLLPYGEAYGIDASEWAVGQVEQSLSDRVILADILTDTEQIRELGPFGCVVTEDLLPCLTDGEAQTAAGVCAELNPLVIHLVTERGEAADLNYHVVAEWASLTGQFTISLEGM
jgi:hypothetical protein